MSSTNTQEPVAWRYKTPTGWHATTDAAKALAVKAHHEMEPLYAAPVSAEPDLELKAIHAAARHAGWAFAKGSDGVVRMVPAIEGDAQAPVAAQAQPTMPPLTDAMRAVLRNEHCVYDSEDALYAALCAAAQTQPLPDSLVPSKPDLEYLRGATENTALPAFLRGQIAAAVKELAAKAQPNAPEADIVDSQQRILDAAFHWAECRDIGPSPTKTAWRELQLRVQNELNYTWSIAKDDAQAQQDALVEIRDLLPAPAPGTELEYLWADAMSRPQGVLPYVKACIQAQQDGDMVSCGCGDFYPANSYGAGFIAAAGHCENCDAAQDTDADKVDAEPDMFWDDDDPERCQDSLHNVLVEVQCNRDLSVGDVVEVQRAIRLPNVSVRITAVEDEDGDGDLEYEIINDAAIDAARKEAGQ